MRAASIGFWALQACLLSSLALGDVLPYPPRPRPPSPPPVTRRPIILAPSVPLVRDRVASPAPADDAELPALDKDTQIAMETADVDVSLSLPGRGILGTKHEPASVLAEVTAAFELKCLQAKRPSTGFVMGYPVHYGEDAGPKVTKFTVTVDAARPVWVQQRQWQPAGAESSKALYHGYIWPTRIARDGKQKVVVKCVLELPVRDGASSFTYILRSGAAWQRPIARETVRVCAEKGLEVRPVDLKGLRPVRQAEREIIWEITNAIPTEDIRVAITVKQGEPLAGVGQ